MAQKRIHFQLVDAVTRKAITASGGFAIVLTEDTADKATLVDVNGAGVSNGQALAAGLFSHYIDDAVLNVDICVMAPGGQFVFLDSFVVGGGLSEIMVDTANRSQVAKIPFSHADQAGNNTETDTGFDLPTNCAVGGVEQGAAILTVDLDATETVDFGLLSTESGGDANGFVAANALDNAGLLKATDGADIAANDPYMSTDGTARSISYTLSDGADTAAGFYLMPYLIF